MMLCGIGYRKKFNESLRRVEQLRVTEALFFDQLVFLFCGGSGEKKYPTAVTCLAINPASQAPASPKSFLLSRWSERTATNAGLSHCHFVCKKACNQTASTPSCLL
jgi:hypothetical protein